MMLDYKLRSKIVDFLADNSPFDRKDINELSDDTLCECLSNLLDHIGTTYVKP